MQLCVCVRECRCERLDIALASTSAVVGVYITVSRENRILAPRASASLSPFIISCKSKSLQDPSGKRSKYGICMLDGSLG